MLPPVASGIASTIEILVLPPFSVTLSTVHKVSSATPVATTAIIEPAFISSTEPEMVITLLVIFVIAY